ncbi:T9SS type A sorting domain-containing protein [Flavobacterium alvei]|uniref:T9SS type A sorting domain-containing protein n=1 Tax=Flavobacterium alvei TaxID=2080416 RepID=UPI0026ECA79D|nr:T9SS type A sorting domain-containing protein [Flavobacterium alvei]
MNKKLLLFVICLMTISFANAQITSIAIVGDGAGGWPTGAVGEVDAHQMTTVDGGLHWTINNLVLTNGAVKFRGNNSWALPYNWGGSTFLSGTGIVDGAAMTSVAGIYNVSSYNISFNKTTLAYSFAFQVISIFGDATPGAWTTDTDMTTVDGNNYTLSNVALVPGALKFRGDHSWTLPYNWGGTVLPSGTAVVDANGFSIPTAGNYNINFNVTTAAYTITSSLATKGFNTSTFSVYPNPAQNSWNFSSSNENIESIQIVDVLGKTIRSSFSKSNFVTVDASGLNSGIYFAKIATASETSTLKLIKD